MNCDITNLLTTNIVLSLSFTAPCYVNWADIGISNFLRLLPISHGGVFAFTSEAEPRRVFLSDIAVSLNKRRYI